MAFNLPASGTIKAQLGINNGGKVHAFFTETCKDEMIPFIPTGDTSLLSQNGIVTNYDEISYTLPYAHYIYEGILYVDPETGSSYARKGQTKIPTGRALEYSNPNTGSFWDQRMWTANGEKVIKQVQDYIDRS